MAHLRVAQNAIKTVGLDQLFFVPCAIPPHKENPELLSAHHRHAMIRLAIRDHPKFEVLRFEIERGGISYTIDTVCYMHQHYPNNRFFLLIGSDNFQDIGRWNRFSKLIQLCEFLVIERPGFPLTLPPPTIDKTLLPSFRYTIIDGSATPISSSEIRIRLREGKTVSHLVPPAVDDYIQKHSLYQASPQERRVSI